jgi:hypothetical protein
VVDQVIGFPRTLRHGLTRILPFDATGPFGKNHFGDLNQFSPTVHGFDEFFGNLYHLNAEEGARRCRLSTG